MPSFSQNLDVYQVRFGTGYGFLGSGDYRVVILESELTKGISEGIDVSFSVNYGKGGYEEIPTESNNTVGFLQANVNIFKRLFLNSDKHQWRFGTGITYYGIQETYVSSYTFSNNEVTDVLHTVSKYDNIGINFILEDAVNISERVTLGAKLFTQWYQNGDAISGLLIKTGIKL